MSDGASTRFVIVCFARTGTHLLESALNQHPCIECFYEPFNTLLYETYSSGEMLAAAWSTPGVVGFPVHWEWQGRDEYTDLWDELRSDRDLKVIQLHRENLLEQYVSKKMLDLTRIHVQHDGEVPAPTTRPTVKIDVRELLRYLFLIETSIAAKHRWFADHDSFFTTYERLTTDATRELTAVQEFLGVDVVPVRPTTVKQEQRSLADVIENFDEVALAVRRSGWGHWVPTSPPAESDAR